MISRRGLLLGALAGSLLSNVGFALTASEEASESKLDQLTYPSFGELHGAAVAGFNRPSAEQFRKAADVINATPRGPRPIDVAQSFIDRFYKSDPNMISQWPTPKPWNPLVVDFFSATSSPQNNDMVAWCAAFANWCLQRSGRRGSQSASSQSFLSSGFKTTTAPKIGDLAIFTCYDNTTGKSLGIGHVAFVKELPTSSLVRIVGGNQAFDGYSSIICERDYPTGDCAVRRHVSGVYVPCTMRLSNFVEVA